MTQRSTAVDRDSGSGAPATQATERMHESNAITILCYEDEIPSFVEVELERLYGNLYSSIPQLHVGGKLGQASTYVVRKGREIITVFLFRVHGRMLEVLNQVIRIEPEEVERFTEYVFSALGSIDVVSFRGIQTEIDAIALKIQRFECLEDIVVSLPGTAEDYTARLGRSTRKNLRYYKKTLMHAFPSFEFSVYEKEAVEPRHILEIIELNRARMSVKSKVSAIDEAETARLIYLARARGLVGVVTIDGRICAGAITSCVGRNYFLSVLAHDPAYDAYRLGNQCCYLTICECIRRAGKEFHFLWGQYDYKYLFLGVQRDLYQLAVYRSRCHFVLNAATASRIAFRGYVRRAKLWARRDTAVSRLANKVFNSIKSLRKTWEK